MKEEQRYGILWSKSLVKAASVVWVIGTYVLVLYGVAWFCAHLGREGAAEVGPAVTLCVFLTTMVNLVASGIASDAHSKQSNDAGSGVCR